MYSLQAILQPLRDTRVWRRCIFDVTIFDWEATQFNTHDHRIIPKDKSKVNRLLALQYSAWSLPLQGASKPDSYLIDWLTWLDRCTNRYSLFHSNTVYIKAGWRSISMCVLHKKQHNENYLKMKLFYLLFALVAILLVAIPSTSLVAGQRRQNRNQGRNQQRGGGFNPRSGGWYPQNGGSGRRTWWACLTFAPCILA